MAGENGATSSPTEFGTFLIGGETIRVPAATLYLAETLQTEFDALGPDQSQREYIRTCLRILSFMIDEESWESLSLNLWKKIRFNEKDQFMTSMRDWMILSGLVEPGEVQAAVDPVDQVENPGTGTLEPSPPNSPLMGFAPETSIGSNDPIH